MELQWKQLTPGTAEGIFSITAKGYMAASLHWATAQGPLPAWTAFSYLPLDSFGRGSFRYTGFRAIPPEATHVAARLIAPDFVDTSIILKALPSRISAHASEQTVCFAVMSDLHMTGKSGRIRRALRLANQADCVLLVGDLTADAAPEQFERLWQLIEEELPETPVLAIAGNHDFPLNPLPRIPQGLDDWPTFQLRLLKRSKMLGVSCQEDPCGAWRATVKGINVFGLCAVSHWRRFVFPYGEQLDWLARQLRQSSSDQKVLLCHAPLLNHNPTRSTESGPAYLSRDGQLQQIMDENSNICFISGHTHISLNEWAGCLDYDQKCGNVYFNDSSVVSNTMRTREALTNCAWTDGTVSFLRISNAGMEISARSIDSGLWIARGYYQMDRVQPSP